MSEEKNVYRKVLGKVVGPKGEDGQQGKDGPYFIPSVANDGTLSWSRSDGSEENIPQKVKIVGSDGEKGEQGPKGDKGDKGDTGDKGADGQPASYQAGTSKFTNGTVSLTSNYDNYSVIITPIKGSNTDGALGEIWISKNGKNITVTNTGGISCSFDYVILSHR